MVCECVLRRHKYITKTDNLKAGGHAFLPKSSVPEIKELALQHGI